MAGDASRSSRSVSAGHEDGAISDEMFTMTVREYMDAHGNMVTRRLENVGWEMIRQFDEEAAKAKLELCNAVEEAITRIESKSPAGSEVNYQMTSRARGPR